MKSNRNVVRYNTIRSTKGGIVGRSGNFNTIEGNFILRGGMKGSDGIRLAGQGHRVINNYVANIAGYGLLLKAGEYIETYLTEKYDPVKRKGTPLGCVPRYGQVKNGVFAHNTFVNVGGIDMELGNGYKSGWSKQQRILLPENNRFIDNVIQQKSRGPVYSFPRQDTGHPLDRFKFQPNIFEGNMVYGIEVGSLLTGYEIMSHPILKENEHGIFRLKKESRLIDAGTTEYVQVDMDGQQRDDKGDIGADEISTLPVILYPLTASEVGSSWIEQ